MCYCDHIVLLSDACGGTTLTLYDWLLSEYYAFAGCIIVMAGIYQYRLYQYM